MNVISHSQQQVGLSKPHTRAKLKLPQTATSSPSPAPRFDAACSPAFPALSIALSLLIFYFDLQLPVGFAAAVLYIGALWLSSYSRSIRFTFFVGVLSSVLTIVAYFASDSIGGLDLFGWLNRFFSLFVIWTTYSFLARQLSYDEKLRKTAGALQRAMDAISSPVFVIDSQFSIQLTNSAAKNFISTAGCEETDFTSLLYSAENLNELPQRLATLQRSEETFTPQEVHFPEHGHYLVEASRIDDPKSAPSEILVSFSDITPLKDSLERLEASNSELKQFAYVASHDLQEPLRKITSFLQILKEDHQEGLNDDAIECIDFAVDGAKRLQNLIEDLLAFSGLVSPKTLKHELVDCNELLEEVLHDLEESIESSGCEVRVSSLPSVWGVKSQLRQVFQNLISNALKFRKKNSSSRPFVEVTGFSKGLHCEFCVKDNGIGIDSEFRDRIFTIFQRLHSREAYSGTGIGLAICKKIVNAHRGRIWVKSEPSVGSEFFFTIRSKRP